MARTPTRDPFAGASAERTTPSPAGRHPTTAGPAAQPPQPGRQRQYDQRFQPVPGQHRQQRLGFLGRQRSPLGPTESRRLGCLGDVARDQVHSLSVGQRDAQHGVHLDDAGRREFAPQPGKEPLHIARRQSIKAARKRAAPAALGLLAAQAPASAGAPADEGHASGGGQTTPG
ncbi:hypothetical protein ACWCO3_01190 [Micromonospora sp. NPDC002411]